MKRCTLGFLFGILSMVFGVAVMNAQVPGSFWRDAYRGSLRAEDVSNLAPHERDFLRNKLLECIASCKVNMSLLAPKLNSKLAFYVSASVAIAGSLLFAYARLQVCINQKEGVGAYEKFILTQSVSDLALLEPYDVAIWKWSALAGCGLVVGALSSALAMVFDKKSDEYEIAGNTLINLHRSLKLIDESVHIVA